MTFTPDDNTDIGRRQVRPLRVRGIKWERAAGEIEDFAKNVLDSINLGKPAPHASTHLGGTDNLLQLDETPTAFTPGSAGSAGSAGSGAAAFDHSHPATDVPSFDDIAALEASIDSSDSSYREQLGLQMQLLFLILNELQAIR